jgi:hypothetical protein
VATALHARKILVVNFDFSNPVHIQLVKDLLPLASGGLLVVDTGRMYQVDSSGNLAADTGTTITLATNNTNDTTVASLVSTFTTAVAPLVVHTWEITENFT